MTQKDAQAVTRRPGRKLALQWGGGAPQHPVGGRPVRAMKNHGSGRRFGNRTPLQVLMQPAQPLIPRVGNLPAHELADPRMADVQFLGNRHPLAAPLLKQCANFFV